MNITTARGDLERIARWLAEDLDDGEAQGAAVDLLAISAWLADVAQISALARFED